jgi:hypothetical protein
MLHSHRRTVSSQFRARSAMIGNNRQLCFSMRHLHLHTFRNNWINKPTIVTDLIHQIRRIDLYVWPYWAVLRGMKIKLSYQEV